MLLGLIDRPPSCSQVDLVEVSPANRRKQWDTLRCRLSDTSTTSEPLAGSDPPSERPSLEPAASAESSSEVAHGTVGDDGPLAGVSDITGAQACGGCSDPKNQI